MALVLGLGPSPPTTSYLLQAGSPSKVWKHLEQPKVYVSPEPSTRRRQWHPTPVLLPGKSHGQRSLVGCGPWGC